MSNDNFGGNRSRYRKVYAYGSNRRPDVRTFVDSVTEVTTSFDFQKIIRDRDYFLIDGQSTLTFPTASNVFRFIEETYSTTTDVEYINVRFPISFDGTPYVGFTVHPESTLSQSNVGYWATDISENGFKANFSAPFSGTMLYRAVYNPSTFPVYTERMPGSGNFAWVSAMSVHHITQSSITMSFDALPGVPESVLSNPFGGAGDPLLNVGQAYSAVTSSFVTNELSGPLTGWMSVIAISTVPTGSPQPVDPP